MPECPNESERTSDSVARLGEGTKIMSDPVITYRGTIYPWHCDHMGHMNVMWYVGKFDEATWHLFGSVGLSRARLRQEQLGLAGVEQHIEYKRELVAGDLITIRSSLLEVREKSVRLLHEMTNQETQELAARTVLAVVCIDINTRRAKLLPPDIRERMASTLPSRIHEQDHD
jgi:acyl-CoA thioester hydrolase